MKSNYIFYMLLILLATTFNMDVYAQKGDIQISGHVVDKETNEHIPYATITIKGTAIGAIADASGHYTLGGLKSGETTFTASFTGYHSQDIEVNVKDHLTVDFELEASTLAVDEVVVTGTRNEISRKKSSVVVNVASSELFEKKAANTVADALSFQPGLRVEYTCQNCGAPSLRINGLEGQYSQTLLNSRPIFSSLASVYGLEMLPASMIERVEVIRGGGSALFGSSAIGGVVNIITKDPKHSLLQASNTTSVYESGAIDTNTALNAAIISDDTRSGVYIFSMLRDRDGYDRNDDGYTEIPLLKAQTLGFRAFHRISDRSRISAEYHYMHEYRRGGDQTDLPAHEANIAEQLEHNINGGALQYDTYSANYKHRVSVYTSAQGINRDSYFGAGQDLDAYGQTRDFTFVGGGQYVYSMDKCIFLPAQLTVGAEYNRNYLHDVAEGYDKDMSQLTYTYGTFFQNEWQSDKFSLLLGGRLDKHNLMDAPVFSPRVNVRYTPADVIGIRASYSSGYRAPQAYDEDLHISSVGGEAVLITMDPDLKPEYSNSISGSVDLYGKIFGIETNFLVEGFYTTIDDVFELVENGTDSDGNILMQRVNASGATVKGVNLELKMGFSPKVTLDGGFTIQSSRFKEAFTWSEEESIEAQDKMFRAPDNYGYITLNYNPTSRFTTSLSTSYTGSMLVQHFGDGETTVDTEVTTPSFWDAGIRLAYDFSLTNQVNMQLSGGVKNIFDSYQNDLDSGELRDAGYFYGPLLPRTYFIGLKFTM